MLRNSSELKKNTEERSQHLEAIATFLRDHQQKWQLQAWLHQHLTVLDDKANATLAVNSIALATLTIFYSTLDASTLLVVKIGFIAALLAIISSILPLARIVFVYWSTTTEYGAPDDMLNELLRVRDERSMVVQASIVKAAAAFCVIAVLLVIDLLAP